jgi:hypothetical protein
MASTLHQELLRIRQELANNPIFPPPNNNPGNLATQLRPRRRRYNKRVTSSGLIKYFITNQVQIHNTYSKRAISMIAGEQWRNAPLHNRRIYSDLSSQVNRRI